MVRLSLGKGLLFGRCYGMTWGLLHKVAPIPGFSVTQRTLSSNFMSCTVLSFNF